MRSPIHRWPVNRGRHEIVLDPSPLRIGLEAHRTVLQKFRHGVRALELGILADEYPLQIGQLRHLVDVQALQTVARYTEVNETRQIFVDTVVYAGYLVVIEIEIGQIDQAVEPRRVDAAKEIVVETQLLKIDETSERVRFDLPYAAVRTRQDPEILAETRKRVARYARHAHVRYANFFGTHGNRPQIRRTSGHARVLYHVVVWHVNASARYTVEYQQYIYYHRYCSCTHFFDINKRSFHPQYFEEYPR